jgi:hypothetical protein
LEEVGMWGPVFGAERHHQRLGVTGSPGLRDQPRRHGSELRGVCDHAPVCCGRAYQEVFVWFMIHDGAAHITSSGLREG